MFGLGPWEIAVIVGAVLLVAGPTLLPKLGGFVGKSLTGLRQSAESFSTNLREEMKADLEEPPLLSPEAEAPTPEPTTSRESPA